MLLVVIQQRNVVMIRAGVKAMHQVKRDARYIMPNEKRQHCKISNLVEVAAGRCWDSLSTFNEYTIQWQYVPGMWSRSQVIFGARESGVVNFCFKMLDSRLPKMSYFYVKNIRKCKIVKKYLQILGLLNQSHPRVFQTIVLSFLIAF